MCNAVNDMMRTQRELRDPNVRQEMLDAYHAGDTHWRGNQLIGQAELDAGVKPPMFGGNGRAIMVGMLPRSGASKQYVTQGNGTKTYSTHSPFTPGPNRLIS